MRTPRLLGHLLAVAALSGGGLCTVARPAAVNEPFWPQFHGPNRDNLSTDTGLLKKWPHGGPERLWTARGIGHGYASVAIAGGAVYTAGNVHDRTAVTAMDMTGRIRWQAANGKAWMKPQGGARATPTVDGDRLYHKNPFGDVVCLNAKTGEQIWGLNILAEFGGENITWGLAESLLIDGPRLICCPGGPETAVVALDKMTGTTVWKSPSTGDQAGYASPLLAEHQGLRMIAVLTSKAMIGVSANTGALLWRVKRETPYDEHINRPIVHDGHVFFATDWRLGGELLKIRVDGQRVSLQPVWMSKQLDTQHGGIVLVDGYLYGACHRSNNAKWVCLDWKTGQMTYAERGVGMGSLTYADGMLYTLSEHGTMGLVRATPDAHQVISQFELPKGGEGPSWAHPVVCGGRLYLRHGDYLHAYDVRGR